MAFKSLLRQHWLPQSLRGVQLTQKARRISQCTQHVVSSVYEDQELPVTNLAELVMRDWSTYGDKTAVVCNDTGKKYSYNQMTDAVSSLAANFLKLGVQKGDVVFLTSPNCAEYGIIYLATVLIGAIITTNNPIYTSNEIAHAVKLSGCKVMISSPESLPAAQQALQSLKDDSPVEEMIVIGEADGWRPLSSLLHSNYSFNSPPTADWTEHLAALPFSSGTTGLPKGVMLSHHNITSNVMQLSICGCRVEYDDVAAGILPFFHIYGQVATLLSGLRNGCTIATMRRFDFVQYLEYIQNHRISLAHLVPPIIIGMTKSPLTDKYDMSSLRVASSGAAPLKVQQSIEFEQRMKPTELIQGYGLTETSPVTNFNETGKQNKHGSVGRLLSNIKARVVDLETEKSLPANKEGELYYHGPSIMKGYWQNKEATDDCLDGEWFRTGDIGYYDDDGYFYVVDRLKELIKYKGFQVAPAELEALLLTHPKILDAAVIGIPSDEAGELPRAYVVTKPKQELADEEIHSFMKENVANHKQLRGGIRMVDEVPKSASGKILRRVLKAEALKDL